MSMLSAQIDHLRELADALDGKYGYQGYEIELRKAADTICELRGSLQVASVDYRHLAAENAKLWELARKLAWCSVVTDCGQCDGACEDGDEWPEGSAICSAVEQMMRELGVET